MRDDQIDDEHGDDRTPSPVPPPRARRPRRAAPALPEPPRVEGLSALLGEIDALRTTLQTDLSLAAAAVEAGAGDVAAEVLDGDRRSVADFERRALSHLRALDAAEGSVPVRVPSPFAADPAFAADRAEPETTPLREPTPLPVARGRRRLLSAAPLAVAAAALVAFAVGLVPLPVGDSPEAGYGDAALAGFTLSRLADEGASTDQLREAAEDLNADIAALVDGAEGDPAAVQQAWLLLQVGNDVLAGQSEQGPLGPVLAETRSLEQQLRRLLERMPASVLPLPSLPAAVVDLLPSTQPYVPPRYAPPQPPSDADPAPAPQPAPSNPPAQPQPDEPQPGGSQPAGTPPPAPEPSPEPAPSSPFSGPFSFDGL